MEGFKGTVELKFHTFTTHDYVAGGSADIFLST